MAFAFASQLAPARALAAHQRATALLFAGRSAFAKSYDELVELFVVRATACLPHRAARQAGAGP